MKQSAGLIALIVFVAGLSFILAARERKVTHPPNTVAAEAPAQTEAKKTGAENKPEVTTPKTEEQKSKPAQPPRHKR